MLSLNSHDRSLLSSIPFLTDTILEKLLIHAEGPLCLLAKFVTLQN